MTTMHIKYQQFQLLIDIFVLETNERLPVCNNSYIFPLTDPDVGAT